ncbi:hypothetical protein PR202_ga18321 [Eleusine coracana subsp. coracana]|uniref:Uncharacterized protein n=1 Tax=Eleusine coracana subsp. coracana TaxID=191504 RepID=A0AAV5CSS3_ELECO|nr:hypothetical protein QOZ80_6AG0506790 [Eleusine coracana subsp. coracana]GJN01086.1 hypothetical protein PR202_ga18321 [Eleusine coracana subsp. coracana]
MADVLVGSSERRVLMSGGYGLPPESLLCRLDQIDLRLRQLEEQRRPPTAAAHADDDVVRRAPLPQHHHTKSLPSALQQVQARGTLMDRLNLLESRIRQLSCELDVDVVAAGNKAAGATLDLEPCAWPEPAPVMEPCREPTMMMMMDKSSSTPAAVVDGSYGAAAEILKKGARQLQRNNKPNPSNKVKSLKEAKCACQKEKKKAERNKTNRRWFGVGC